MLKKFIVLVLILATPTAWSKPLSVIPLEHSPLAAELGSRVAARASRLAQDPSADPRMLPGAQDLAAIRRVAETLIMLGQEVIPSIIGEMPGGMVSTALPVDIPNDTLST